MGFYINKTSVKMGAINGMCVGTIIFVTKLSIFEWKFWLVGFLLMVMIVNNSSD